MEICGKTKSLCDTSDIPPSENIAGPTELVERAKIGKSVTIKHVLKKTEKAIKTNRESKVEKRKKSVLQVMKRTDCLSSDMNNCLALVKPDCSKPEVLKSGGIQKAVINLLSSSIPMKGDNDNPDAEKWLKGNAIIVLDQADLPSHLAHTTKFISVEFAGIKFKTKAISRTQYLQHIERNVLKSLTYFFQNVQRIVICEEKYSYTPDNFKAATRWQRQKDNFFAISHLKSVMLILTERQF